MRAIWTCILVVIASFSVAEGSESVCEPPADKLKPSQIQVFYCDGQGALFREEVLFAKTQKPSQIIYYEQNRMVKKDIFNLENEQTVEFHFLYNSDDSYLMQRISEKGYITGQELRQGSPEGESFKLKKRWHYLRTDKDEPRELSFIDSYLNDKVIITREIYIKGQYEGVYTFVYPSVPTIFNHIDKFSAVLVGGRKIEYDYTQGVDVYAFIEDLGFSVEEKNRRLDIFKDHRRPKVLIIDTGFDVKHPELVHKFYQNQEDPLDGVDNDDNGIVDDFIGFGLDDADLLSNNINERLTISTSPSPLRPFSHGTHVATTVLKDLDEYALIGVAGNMSDVDLLNRSSRLLIKHQVRFSNMSFSFGNRKLPFSPGSSSFRALNGVILSNSQTLFAVASGNDGLNLDHGAMRHQYPASYEYENLLVVGALETGEFVETKASSYLQAEFSNTGIETVDIFAPGVDLEAGSVGGSSIAVSGTSMASPYALNVILKMAKEAPALNILELKNAVLYSAYIPDLKNPYECISGGMVFERRALKLVQLMRDEGVTARSAALLVRRMVDYLLKGEFAEEVYIDQLVSFWATRLETK